MTGKLSFHACAFGSILSLLISCATHGSQTAPREPGEGWPEERSSLDAQTDVAADQASSADQETTAHSYCLYPPSQPSQTIPLFSFDDPVTLPYPFNAFTRPDSASPTGLVISLELSNTLLIDLGLESVFEPEFVLSLINGLSGFSTFAPVLVGFSGPIGPSLLSASPYDLASWESPVILVPLEEGVFGKPLRFIPVIDEYESPAGPITVLQVHPYIPLFPGRTYALLVTRGLTGLDGLRISPHPHFAHLTGCPGASPPDSADPELLSAAKTSLAPLLEALENSPLCPCDLAAATVFTTAAHDAVLRTAYSLFHGPSSPPANLSLDENGDGEIDTFPPDQLPFLPPEVTEFPTMSIALRGAFDVPDFRSADLDVHLHGGALVPSGTLRIPFAMMLPAAPSAQPFKLVVMGHGHSGHKERIAFLAHRFGEQGLALAAVDALGHGELFGLGLFITPNFAETHGSFLQSQINLMRFLAVLQQLKDLDVFPPAAPDGIPDLDLTSIGYVGESLGSLLGAVACSLDPTVSSLVLNVGGGGLANCGHQFQPGPETTATGLGLIELKILLQNYVDPFDPINYAAWLRHPASLDNFGLGYTPDRSNPASPRGWDSSSRRTDEFPPPRQILMQNVTGDPAMDGPPTADLARALSLTYVCPCPVAVPFLPIAQAPAAVSGLFYFDGPRHGFFLAGGADDPENSDKARIQAATFLSSSLLTGTPLVIDPYAP